MSYALPDEGAHHSRGPILRRRRFERRSAGRRLSRRLRGGLRPGRRAELSLELPAWGRPRESALGQCVARSGHRRRRAALPRVLVRRQTQPERCAQLPRCRFRPPRGASPTAGVLVRECGRIPHRRRGQVGRRPARPAHRSGLLHPHAQSQRGELRHSAASQARHCPRRPRLESGVSFRYALRHRNARGARCRPRSPVVPKRLGSPARIAAGRAARARATSTLPAAGRSRLPSAAGRGRGAGPRVASGPDDEGLAGTSVARHLPAPSASTRDGWHAKRTARRSAGRIATIGAKPTVEGDYKRRQLGVHPSDGGSAAHVARVRPPADLPGRLPLRGHLGGKGNGGGQCSAPAAGGTVRSTLADGNA